MPTKGSSAVISKNRTEVLLVLREDIRLWALSAGHLEPGETFEQDTRANRAAPVKKEQRLLKVQAAAMAIFRIYRRLRNVLRAAFRCSPH